MQKTDDDLKHENTSKIPKPEVKEDGNKRYNYSKQVKTKNIVRQIPKCKRLIKTNKEPEELALDLPPIAQSTRNACLVS
jgi:hypothetical protein